ncbi:MAG TPA: hypothetical protein DFH97_05845 [Clostridiales bacterium]|nr:hypothetical protein [Clostridiales bacterium]
MPSKPRQRTHLDFRPVHSIIELSKKQGFFGLFFRFPAACTVTGGEKEENQQIVGDHAGPGGDQTQPQNLRAKEGSHDPHAHMPVTPMTEGSMV